MPLMSSRDAKAVTMFPGVVRRTVTDGERVMLIEVTMDAGASVPNHTHPHEQTGYLVSGRGRFRIGDEEGELSPGDCWLVPTNVPHEFTALERSVFVDVFSPPREDYR